MYCYCYCRVARQRTKQWALPALPQADGHWVTVSYRVHGAVAHLQGVPKHMTATMERGEVEPGIPFMCPPLPCHFPVDLYLFYLF